jgi:peptidoglycan hydrolase-like protein with peptidoglycan-binding domain
MSPPFPGREIDPGESGDDVRIWQERMKERGWRIEVTGVHDEQSVAVARAFQLEKGLGLDGIVGPETWDGAFKLPVTPGPGGGTGSGRMSVKIRLYVNRTGDDVEIGAEITNDGDVAIAANTLTITVRVVNPLASPDSREYELSRFEMPMIESLAAGKTTYQLAYDSVPRRRDPFQADGWIHDSSTTYDTDSISFE